VASPPILGVDLAEWSWFGRFRLIRGGEAEERSAMATSAVRAIRQLDDAKNVLGRLGGEVCRYVWWSYSWLRRTSYTV
jgi:hypothetical protein